MYYVYILKSLAQPGAIYIGYTSDLKARLKEHNPGSKTYSSRHAPWEVETYMAFHEKSDAEKFEKYLKSNSGKAFLRKRLISENFKIRMAKFNNGRGSIIKNSQNTAID